MQAHVPAVIPGLASKRQLLPRVFTLQHEADVVIHYDSWLLPNWSSIHRQRQLSLAELHSVVGKPPNSILPL